jgi:hypothetical protein
VPLLKSKYFHFEGIIRLAVWFCGLVGLAVVGFVTLVHWFGALACYCPFEHGSKMGGFPSMHAAAMS